MSHQISCRHDDVVRHCLHATYAILAVISLIDLSTLSLPYQGSQGELLQNIQIY